MTSRESNRYRGRFAPTPTGSLHFGSLITAVTSYLDAKHHGGEWLVRIEDIDTPRVIRGSAENILRMVEAYGMRPDGKIVYQSKRIESYHASLHKLRAAGMIYPCACSRREIADSSVGTSSGGVYPGNCRASLPVGKAVLSLRVRTDTRAVTFRDDLHGERTQCLQTQVGDFVLYRNDGVFSYQLAVVIDDAEQGITHVVRGADLIDSTPRQVYLQQLLGFATPAYLHLPVAVNEAGQKLSKQSAAPPVNQQDPVTALYAVLRFLNQHPPPYLAKADVDKFWAWAIGHWDRRSLPRVFSKNIFHVE